MSDVTSRFNVEMVDKFSILTRLLGHEYMPQNIGCIGFNILSGESDFYTAFHQEITGVWTVQVSFSSSTSMDL